MNKKKIKVGNDKQNKAKKDKTMITETKESETDFDKQINEEQKQTCNEKQNTMKPGMIRKTSQKNKTMITETKESEAGIHRRDKMKEHDIPRP